MNGTKYGLDLYNLSRKNISVENFKHTSMKITEALRKLTTKSIKAYYTKNDFFDSGFNVE